MKATKAVRSTITMLGEKMQLELSKHCVYRIGERTHYSTTEVLYAIKAVLERDDVAENILLEVLIGDEVVILDKKMSYSIAITVGTNEIIVETLFSDEKNSNPKVEAQQHCIVIADFMTIAKGFMLPLVA